jgi:hypothetical protein
VAPARPPRPAPPRRRGGRAAPRPRRPGRTPPRSAVAARPWTTAKTHATSATVNATSRHAVAYQVGKGAALGRGVEAEQVAECDGAQRGQQRARAREGGVAAAGHAQQRLRKTSVSVSGRRQSASASAKTHVARRERSYHAHFGSGGESALKVQHGASQRSARPAARHGLRRGEVLAAAGGTRPETARRPPPFAQAYTSSRMRGCGR